MSETSAIRAVSREDDLEPEHSGRGTAIARLMETIRAGGNRVDGRAAADKLDLALQTLAVNAPTAQTRDLLQGVLDSKELDPFFNSSGEPGAPVPG